MKLKQSRKYPSQSTVSPPHPRCQGEAFAGILAGRWIEMSTVSWKLQPVFNGRYPASLSPEPFDEFNSATESDLMPTGAPVWPPILPEIASPKDPNIPGSKNPVSALDPALITDLAHNHRDYARNARRGRSRAANCSLNGLIDRMIRIGK